jgi:integrase
MEARPVPRLTRKIPAYRHHKARDLAVVTLDGHDRYLGPHGSPESRREYDRLVGEWLAADRHAPPDPGAGATPGLTVDGLILRYWDFARGYYVRDGRPARELDNIKDALRHLRRAYGPTPAASFGPLALKAVRAAMVDAGLARNTVNARLGKIRRLFKWAVADELVPPAVLEGLRAVAGLRAGRGGVRETAPVRPVDADRVAAVLPHVSAPVRAMIRVQELTGMRPGEVMSMRAGDLDRTGEIWVYRPGRHKTQDKGFSRAIPIGPRARAVLEPWLKDDPSAYLFSPAEAVRLRNEAARRGRKSPMTPSQAARRPKPRPKRGPRDRYDKRTYHTAIGRACDRAFPHPTLGAIGPRDLTPDQGAELLAWRKAHRWHPNQLRHSTATTVRATFGLEAAQVVLGHSKANTTEIYAERDLGLAVEVMRQVG